MKAAIHLFVIIGLWFGNSVIAAEPDIKQFDGRWEASSPKLFRKYYDDAKPLVLKISDGDISLPGVRKEEQRYPIMTKFRVVKDKPQHVDLTVLDFDVVEVMPGILRRVNDSTIQICIRNFQARGLAERPTNIEEAGHNFVITLSRAKKK